MIETYFENIRKEILNVLDTASAKIVIAVYWFTNEELFQKLLDKLEEGCKIELIIHNDFINNRDTGLAFQQFIDNGGQFYFSTNDNPMHNKFCVIDNSILVNGSYNWTYYAENKNRENILVLRDVSKIINQFSEEFDRLKLLAEKVKNINQLTKFEVDESTLLHTRDYLANDLIYQASSTNRKSLVQKAIDIAPKNIDIQITANKLNLAKKYKLKHSIGASLINDGYKIIIEKGAEVPAKFTSISRTSENNQTKAISNIHYGEKIKASQNKKIATISLNGIPIKPAGIAQIKFHFSIDIYGQLKMIKYSLDTGKKIEIKRDVKHLLEKV